MSWKKMILGEKMPDKNDPKYKDRYEKETAAGRKAARMLKIDKAAGWLQRFALAHPRTFLAIAFGTVIACFSMNIYRMAAYYNARSETESAMTATQHQETILKQKHTTQ